MTSPGRQGEHKARIVTAARRIVVKVGSGVLSSRTGLRHDRVEALSAELHQVAAQREVILVTSGAIASGQGRLGLSTRPASVRMKQALAAVGQIDLMGSYERAFARHDRRVAQILLTRDDFTNRGRYLNAEHTLTTLLELGIIPIINENDSVAVEEVKFGDNDLLSALTATLLDADLLLILSDVGGLYATDPSTDPDAALVPLLESIDDETRRRAGPRAGTFGTGGMASKVQAAAVAHHAGIPTIIANGTHPQIIEAALDPLRETGTLILAAGDHLARRKHWIAYTLNPAGSLAVDRGARDAVTERQRSLLPSGVLAVEGRFGAGECVRCLDPEGREFARGLVNYSDSELRKILGVHTREIESRLGYKVADEVIHRDDLVILASGGARGGPGRAGS
jgi:glutamate 5-kinase